MLAITRTAAVHGTEGIPVNVEVDSARGLPQFNIIGLGDTAVKEASDRVKAALLNSSFEYPPGRITVNLSPAWIRKHGSHYDLAMAIGVLASQKKIRFADLDKKAFIGELALTGEIMGVTGVLPMLSGLIDSGVEEVYLPRDNAGEGSLIAGESNVKIIAAENLRQVYDMVSGRREKTVCAALAEDLSSASAELPDFADVKGNTAAKEAIVTAVAGGHGLLMIGPPGTGKTLLAKRIPTILPKMSMKEKLETSAIYSLAGKLNGDRPLITERPFRQLNQRATVANLIGGGPEPMPGEVSLADNGVLFIDEFLEFGRTRLEALRKPLEEKKVSIMRRGQLYTFPANFMLVGAANPCRCGYCGDPVRRCTCTQTEIDRYRSRLSGPLKDRIDMCIEISGIDYDTLTGTATADSASMAKRVEKAREMQRKRFEGLGITGNAEMGEREIEEFCRLGEDEKKFIKAVYDRGRISPRRYHKILKLARTAADLDGRGDISADDIAIALNYTRAFGEDGE